MVEVDILLAAYNGEKFIAEQIDSLLGQTFQDFRILIRDDGSSDNTPAIIEAYVQKFPDKIEIIHDNVVCRSPGKNFFQLLKHATADYVMFSDQDDVWLKYKIQITLDYMKDAERENSGKPVLTFCANEVVNERLESLNRFSSLGINSSRYEFKALLSHNCIPGHTMMLNREAWKNIGTYSEVIELYDWWISMYVGACGVICYVPMSLALYRQHQTNVVGGMYRKGRIQRIISRIISNPFEKFKTSREKFNRQRMERLLFSERYSHMMKPDDLKALDDYIQLFGQNRLKRLLLIKKTGYLRERSLFERTMHFLKLILL